MPELIWDGKYDPDGRRVAPLRVQLPFQTVETINESAQDRQLGLDRLIAGHDPSWRNRLIWGDKKYVLPSLLPEFAGKVDLIYIDAPFDTGQDFSFRAEVGDEEELAEFTKEPSIIEQKAYRDTWGVTPEQRARGITHLDKYLQWFSETITLLRELLKEEGSIYVHLDWHIGHHAKLVLDQVFGRDKFRNEIIWWYYDKFQGNVNHLPRNHDTIFHYVKSDDFYFSPIMERRDEVARQIKRKWDKESGRIVNVKGEDGKVEYQESTERRVDDVWFGPSPCCSQPTRPRILASPRRRGLPL